MPNYTVLYEPDDGETVSPNYEVLYEPDDTETVTDDYNTSWLGRQWNALGDYITSGGVTNSNIANRILEQEQYQKDLEEEEQKRLANEYYLRNRDTGESFLVPSNNEYSTEDRFRIDALDPVDLTGFNGAENLTKYQQDYLRDFNPQQYELLTGIQNAKANRAMANPNAGDLNRATFNQPVMGTIAQSVAAGGDQVLLPADWLIDKGIQGYDWLTDNKRPEDYQTFVGSARERIENAKLNNELTGGIQGGAGNVLFGLTSYAPMIATSIATGGASAPIQAAAVQAADVGLGKFAQYEDQGADIGTALAAAGIDTVGEFLSDLPLGAASKAQSLFGGGAKGGLATLGANALEAGVGNVIAGATETMADDFGLGDAYNPTPEERMQNSLGAFKPGAALGVGLNVGGKVLGKAGQKISSKLAERRARARIDSASEAMDLMADAEGTRALPEPDERLLLGWEPEKERDYRLQQQIQQQKDLLGGDYYLTDEGDVIGAKPETYNVTNEQYTQKPIIENGRVVGVERQYRDVPMRDFDEAGNEIDYMAKGETRRIYFNENGNVDDLSTEVPGMETSRSYDLADLLEAQKKNPMTNADEIKLIGWDGVLHAQDKLNRVASNTDDFFDDISVQRVKKQLGVDANTARAYLRAMKKENVANVDDFKDEFTLARERKLAKEAEAKAKADLEIARAKAIEKKMRAMAKEGSANVDDYVIGKNGKPIKSKMAQYRNEISDFKVSREGDILEAKPSFYEEVTDSYVQTPIIENGKVIGVERKYKDIPMRDFDEFGNEIDNIVPGETKRIFFNDVNKDPNVDTYDMEVPGMESNRSYDPQVKIERTETIPQVEGAAVPKDKTFKNVEEFKEHQAAVAKQKVEDPVITKVEPKPVLEKQTNKVDVQRISRDELGRRPDLMQFKQSDDKVTGTVKGNRIEGQRWDDTAAGPLLVWEPIDPLAYGLSGNQKYIVANGHHRLEFGDRMNVKDYNVQVLREADGWSAADVKEKAALDNINDGKGTIEDQVTFLRSYAKQVGPEEALAKAQELGFQRKDATPIAIYGSDDLLNAFRRGKINQTQAAAIARTTADPALQRVGIKFAMQKKDLAAIENYLRNATHANEQMFAGDQISIFGDMGDAATNKAMALSELANDYASKLKRRINVVKPAVNNQEIAGETKVKVLKNADKEVANLIQQADKWDNWMLYPELRKQLEDEIAAGRTLEAKKKAEKQKNWMADPERGATIIFDDLIDGVAKITAKAKDSLKETVSDIFALDMKDLNLKNFRHTGMDDSEKYLTGLLGKFNKMLSYPRTIAQKFPEFAPTYKAGQGQIERASTNTLEFNEKFQPYLNLSPESQQVVGNLMSRNRQRVLQGQKKFDETYQNWRALGLSDIEAKAALQLREGFNLAVDKIVEAKKAEEQLKVATNPNLAKMGDNYLNKKFAELDAWGAELKDKNYMPLSRRGEWYVHTDDGKYFKMFDRKSEAEADAKRLDKLGVTGRYGRRGTHYSDNKGIQFLDKNLDQITDGELNAIGGNHGEIKGFPAHLVEAKGTSGFDTNYVRNIAEYFQLLSRYNARKLGDLEFKNAEKAIRPEQNALLNYAQKYQADLNNPTNKWFNLAQKIVVVRALSNPLTSAINMTQPLTTTLPECVKYLGEGKALKVFSNAFKTQADILRKKTKGINKELLQGLEEAERIGLVGDNATGTMAALAKGEKPSVLVDKILLAGQNATEHINRQHAFIAGWDIADRIGIKDFNQKFDFAKSFIEQTQFNTNKGNRNELSRALGGFAKIPMTFKSYGGNMFKFYADLFKGDLRSKRAAMESLAIGTLLGGYKYIPFAAAIMTLANGAGYDVEKGAKDKLNKLFGSDVPAEVLFQGLGSIFGLNISGNLQSEDYSEAIDLSSPNKFRESIGKLALGASGRTLEDAWSGLGSIWNGDIYKGIEQMSPRIIQNPMRAYRAYKDNAFTNSKGQPIVKNPTTGELIGQALGMTPKRKNQFYEEQTKNYDIINKLSDTSYADRAAKAYLDGDMQRAGEILLEAQQAGQKVTDTKFKNAIKRLKVNPVVRQLDNLPKDIRAQRIAEIRENASWMFE